MATNQLILQPGPVFYDVFLGALRVHGTNFKAWATENGTNAQNAKLAALGGFNGPVAKALRAKMVSTIGEDMFRGLYEHRMLIEQGDVA